MASLWSDPRIPILFSQTVLENLYAAHVWTEGFNDNYAGELKGKGSVLRIISFPTPTINDVTVSSSSLIASTSTGLVTYERLGPASQELVIDMDKDWAIAEDRVQDMLANPKAFTALAKNAGWAGADIIDRDLARRINASASNAGLTGTGTSSEPIVGHGASDDMTAYGVMERMREELKNNRVPDTDLHFFCPNWFMTILRLDLRFSGFGTVPSRTTARGEQIIELAGMTIHETINSLDGAGTSFHTTPDSNSQNRVYAVWKGAATYVPYVNVDEMTDMIPASQNALSHDNLLRSRFLWGAKVTRPDGCLYQVVQRGSYEA